MSVSHLPIDSIRFAANLETVKREMKMDDAESWVFERLTDRFYDEDEFKIIPEYATEDLRSTVLKLTEAGYLDFDGGTTYYWTDKWKERIHAGRS